MPHEAPRLQATPVGRALAWWRHLPSGFYTICERLSAADENRGITPRNVVLLLISAASQHWGLELHRAAKGTGFMFPLADPSPAKLLVPLQDLLPAWLLQRDCKVFKMDMQLSEQTPSCCELKVYIMKPVPPPKPRAAAAARTAMADGSASDSSDTDTLASEGEPLTDLSSDVESLKSSDRDCTSSGEGDSSDAEHSSDSISEAACSDTASDGLSERVTVQRAPAHVHTAWENDHFILTDNRNYPNVRMRMKEMFQHPDLLGAGQSSKTLSVAQFGDTREEPTVTRLVLHAWALWRTTSPPGFLATRPQCRRAWENDVKALREEIAALRRPLNARARQLLGDWLPSVLPRERP